jgi:hypothetical protein
LREWEKAGIKQDKEKEDTPKRKGEQEEIFYFFTFYFLEDPAT